MGEAKRRLKDLIGQPCVFCGGTVVGTTVDHIPPKCFFINSQRPKSHEVPACERCNRGSSAHDQVAALFCVVAGRGVGRDIPEAYHRRLADGVHNNDPRAISYMHGAVTHLRESRLLILPPRRGLVTYDARLYTEYLEPWAAKQSLALYHNVTGRIIGELGVMFIKWISNYQVMTAPSAVERILKMMHSGATLKQGKIEVPKQFFYRYSLHGESTGMSFVMTMHEATAVVGSVFQNLDALPYLSTQAQFSAFQTCSELGVHRIPNPLHPGKTAFALHPHQREWSLMLSKPNESER